MTVLPMPARRRVAWPVAFAGRRPVVLALVAILLVAGGIRAAGAASPAPRSTDERAYAALASDLAADGSYGREMRRPFHWPPGAPAAFAVVKRFTPGWSAVRSAQVLFGVVLVLVAFGLGLLASGPRVGLGAAAAVALYPPLVMVSGTLLSEPLGALLLASATLASLWALRGHAWSWWVAGALWGTTVLTRADFLLAPLLIGGVLLLLARRSPAGRSLRHGACALVAGALIVIVPWSVMASTKAGHVVPVTSGSGAALFVGTYLPGGGTTLGAKRELAGEIVAADPEQTGRPASRLSAMTMLDVVANRHPALDREAALQREVRVNLARYPLKDPVAYAGMTLDKLRRMWLVPSRVGAGSTPGWLRVLQVPLVLACFALALFALRRTRDPRLALLLAPVFYALTLHAISVANPRHALVPLPLLLVAGLVGAAVVWSGRRSGALSAPGVQRAAASA